MFLCIHVGWHCSSLIGRVDAQVYVVLWQRRWQSASVCRKIVSTCGFGGAMAAPIFATRPGRWRLCWDWTMENVQVGPVVLMVVETKRCVVIQAQDRCPRRVGQLPMAIVAPPWLARGHRPLQLEEMAQYTRQVT